MKKIHDTEHYEVVVVDDTIVRDSISYAPYFAVVHKESNITEHRTPQRVEAIMAAENFNHTMTTKPWTWVQKAVSQAESEQLRLFDDAPIPPQAN